MLALVLALAVSGPLDEGIGLYQSLEFEKATIFFQRFVLNGDVAPKTRAEAFLWLGLSYGQLGDTDSARQSFHRAMVNDATLRAPPDTPPAFVAMIEEERKSVVGTPHVDVKPPPPAPKPPPAPPPAPPPSTGPGFAAVASGVSGAVLAVAAIGTGGAALYELSVAYDTKVAARPAIDAYDNAVTAGVVAGILGGAAAVAGGVSAVLFLE